MSSSVAEQRSRARIAARNNAEWCDIVCRTHGILGRFDLDAWVAPRRTPPYYPDAVTLERSADGERILERIDTTTSGCSIKDSFATLDLSASGFEVMHEAEWIHRGPRPAPATDDSGTTWVPLTTPGELEAWEAAWSGDGGPTDLFRAALLDDLSVTILGGVAGGSIVAGAVLNRTADVVGISNLFTTGGDLDGAWTGCLGYLELASPGSAVVGYEAGDELAAAHRQGFESVGPLRVWLMR
jgi:hypothetical protein